MEALIVRLCRDTPREDGLGVHPTVSGKAFFVTNTFRISPKN
jgi:hypothetical protein